MALTVARSTQKFEFEFGNEGGARAAQNAEMKRDRKIQYISDLPTLATKMMHQVPAMRVSEQLEAAWDCEVGVPQGVRTDSKTGCSSHTGLATWKQRVGAHARAPLRSAVRPWAGEEM